VSLIAVANQEFKNKYGMYVRNALFLAVAIHLLLFYFTPTFTFKPYVLREQYFEAVELPTAFELPPPPKEVSAPVVPIEAAEGEEDAADASAFAPTSYNNIDEVPMPPPPSGDQAQEFYAFDEAPVLIKFVSPKYPDLARQAGIEGTVLLNVLVGDDGKVVQVSVIQSDVTPAMEKAAQEAAKQFMFKPAKQRTVAVKARVAIPIRFKLHGN
jgi:periplasmic protein TonB